MGADRRGPLAAFVIVALIAAILLVTSVRSQAAPWFSTRYVSGPATEPHLWGSVTGGLDQVVHQGEVLVRKAAHAPADDPTRTEAMGASTSVAASRHVRAASTAHHVARTSHRPAAHHQPAHTPRHAIDHAVTDEPVEAPTTPPPGHGRHLGWYQHHGQEQSVDSSGTDETDETSGPADSDDYPGHGHGHGQGHGHGPGPGHGRAHGQGHAFGHDRH